MLTDAALLFSDAQALTGAKAYASTDYINRVDTKELGVSGLPLRVVANIDVAFATADNDIGVLFSLQSDDNSSFSSPTYLRHRYLTFASLTLGARINLFTVPHGTTEQYLRIYMECYQSTAPFYTAGDHNFTGTVTLAMVTASSANDAGVM